jgi:hypothetical protein
MTPNASRLDDRMTSILLPLAVPKDAAGSAIN